MKTLTRLMVAACATWSITVGAFAEDACDFVEIDIGDADRGLAHDLNHWGQVVGMLSNDEPYRLRPFAWQEGKTRLLPPLDPGQPAAARAINDLGRIVGDSGSLQGHRAVTWIRSEVRALPGKFEATATAINNHGQIAGYAFGGPCLVWPDASSEPFALPGLGGDECHVSAISEAGVVVGIAETGAGLTRGFVWQHGLMHDVGPSADHMSQLLDVNAFGLAVGQVQVDTGYGVQPIVHWGRRTRVLSAVGTAEAINVWGSIAFLSYTIAPNETHLLLGDLFGNVQDEGALGGSVASGALLMNDRFQLAWNPSSASGGASLSPHFCQLRRAR
jgi:probable HAF family extracellular repeat protein